MFEYLSAYPPMKNCVLRMKEKPHWVAGFINLWLYKNWVLLFTFENIDMKLNLLH